MAHVIKAFERDELTNHADKLLRTDISAVKCSCNRTFDTVSEWSHHATEQQQIHIEGLQVTLANRNRQIEELRNRVTRAEAEGPGARAVKDAYKRGWKDCASQLMTATQDAANALRVIRSDAFKEYLNGDKL